MVTKLRLLSLFALANAMGSLTMILPASPADRDQASHVADDQTHAEARQGAPSRAGAGGEGDLSLLVAHDVFYENCAGGGECGNDRGDRGNKFRPDLIGGGPPPNPLPFGNADDGRNRGNGGNDHDGAGAGSWSPGAMPSGLFPFMPSNPFAGAPGGESHDGQSGGGRSSGGGPANYPGLGDNAGTPPNPPGGSLDGGGAWQPIPIPSGVSVSGASPAVGAADAVPEPASLLLLATASLMFILFRRRRRRVPD